mmetsp:Transcript_17435/g.57076  ORF Transcript_17435/g.57076 Transcript_17435/m.57076 type:complete len:205 (-) Transcript_17435:4004-4618(-)
MKRCDQSRFRVIPYQRQTMPWVAVGLLRRVQVSAHHRDVMKAPLQSLPPRRRRRPLWIRRQASPHCGASSRITRGSLARGSRFRCQQDTSSFSRRARRNKHRLSAVTFRCSGFCKRIRQSTCCSRFRAASSPRSQGGAWRFTILSIASTNQRRLRASRSRRKREVQEARVWRMRSTRGRNTSRLGSRFAGFRSRWLRTRSCAAQ